jgi:plasmid stabilization system protein ParE
MGQSAKSIISCIVMKIVITPRAQQSLKALHLYIAENVGLPEVANKVRNAIMDAINLAATPETHEMGYRHHSGLRALRAKNCTVLYRSTADTFTVIYIKYEYYSRPW